MITYQLMYIELSIKYKHTDLIKKQETERKI